MLHTGSRTRSSATAGRGRRTAPGRPAAGALRPEEPPDPLHHHAHDHEDDEAVDEDRGRCGSRPGSGGRPGGCRSAPGGPGAADPRDGGAGPPPRPPPRPRAVPSARGRCPCCRARCGGPRPRSGRSRTRPAPPPAGPECTRQAPRSVRTFARSGAEGERLAVPADGVVPALVVHVEVAELHPRGDVPGSALGERLEGPRLVRVEARGARRRRRRRGGRRPPSRAPPPVGGPSPQPALMYPRTKPKITPASVKTTVSRLMIVWKAFREGESRLPDASSEG